MASTNKENIRKIEQVLNKELAKGKSEQNKALINFSRKEIKRLSK